MTEDVFRKYREIKALVERSYPDGAERKDVWLSVRQLLLYYNEHEFRPEEMDVFTRMVSSGKPLCHLDVCVKADDSISFYDMLDESYVGFPLTHTLHRYDGTKKVYRFFYVNPDILGGEDFSFRSKFAQWNTCILLTAGGENITRVGASLCIENPDIPDTARFLVCAEVIGNSVKYGGVFEIQNSSAEAFSAVEIGNDERDMQGLFCKRVKAAFPDLEKMRELAAKNAVRPWQEIIRKSFF